MISSVTQRPRARLDLLEQFVYFGEEANVELAERYLDGVQSTCATLITHPDSGMPYQTDIVRLKGLRPFPVKANAVVSWWQIALSFESSAS